MSTLQEFDVVVQAAHAAARDILSFELRRPDGGELPAFTAGAHIDLHLPNGLVRNYSLVNSEAERGRYVIAVSRDANSTGGSKYLFETQLVGQTVKLSAPRNNFALNEDAAKTVLIAGGIGITPLRCMIHRLEAIGADWQLHYGARDRASAAFREELEALEAAQPGRVHFNFDDEAGVMLDVAAAVAAAPAEAHLYCCGPAPMLEIYKTAAEGRDPETVHLEYFNPPEPAAPAAAPGDREPYEVVINSTGESFMVNPGESILTVLLSNGVNASYSCQEGICGSCIAEVLEGEPEHKDFILSENERKRLMTICVSGCKSKKLVIEV